MWFYSGIANDAITPAALSQPARTMTSRNRLLCTASRPGKRRSCMASHTYRTSKEYRRNRSPSRRRRDKHRCCRESYSDTQSRIRCRRNTQAHIAFPSTSRLLCTVAWAVGCLETAESMLRRCTFPTARTSRQRGSLPHRRSHRKNPTSSLRSRRAPRGSLGLGCTFPWRGRGCSAHMPREETRGGTRRAGVWWSGWPCLLPCPEQRAFHRERLEGARSSFVTVAPATRRVHPTAQRQLPCRTLNESGAAAYLSSSTPTMPSALKLIHPESLAPHTTTSTNSIPTARPASSSRSTK